jgi:hypothetical protein
MREREIELFFVPSNNHGCLGQKIFIVPINQKQGIVRKGIYCSRCFSEDDIFPEGTLVGLPDWCEDWGTAVAEEEHESFSFAGSTYVRPSDLVIISYPFCKEEG